MNCIPFQDVFLKRLERQMALPLEIDAGGYCVHIGKISYGFRDYFLPLKPEEFTFKANTLFEETSYDLIYKELNYQIMELFSAMENSNFSPKVIHYNKIYTHSNDPYLWHMHEKQADLVNALKLRQNSDIYTYIYVSSDDLNHKILNTLKEWDITEIRTTDCNVEKIKNAHDMGFKISVILYYYPNKDLEIVFDNLKSLNGIIDHLIIEEEKVTQHNQVGWENAKIYKDLHYYVYDDGFTYDIFEHVIKNKYSYSVFDLNSAVNRLTYTRFNGGGLFNFLPKNENFLLK